MRKVLLPKKILIIAVWIVLIVAGTFINAAAQGCVNVGIGSVTADKNILCAGQTTVLTANNIIGDNAVVDWYSQSGGSGTHYGTGTTLTNVGAGTYYAFVTGDCGAPAEASITIGTSGLAGFISSQSNINCFEDGNTGSVFLDANNGILPAGSYGFSNEDNASAVYVRFKDDVNAPPIWNSITALSTPNLTDAGGNNSGIGFQLLTTEFNVFHDGPQTGDNSGVYPDAVLKNYYYFGIYGAPETVSGKITGLDVAKTYSISFYAGSSFGNVPDNGTTTYTIGGQTVALYVQNNKQNTVSINNLHPDEDGSITFTMKKAADGTPVGYLNAFVIRALKTDNLAAGDYTYAVRDAAGCVSVIPVTITKPSDALQGSVSDKTDVLCNGGTTGAATLAATGGTEGSGYTFDFGSGYSATNTVSNISAGDYTYHVKDGNGCIADIAVTITEPSTALQGSVSDKTDVLCNGGTTGAATLTATGGTEGSGYTFDFGSGYSATNTVSNISAGDYTYHVKDGNGCIADIAVTITEPPAVDKPTITPQSVTTFCKGGSVVLSGTEAAAYQWYKNGIAIAGEVNQNLTATNRATYTLVVTNASGCFSPSSDGIDITVHSNPDKPVIVADGVTNFCDGGKVTLTSTTAAGYLWYKTGVLIDGANKHSYVVTASGNYKASVISAAGCVSPQSDAIAVTVRKNPVMPVVTADGSTTFCVGGSVNLTSTLSANYQWYKGSDAITGATSQVYNANSKGSYSVRVTTVSGCSSTLSVPVDVNTRALPAPVITVDMNQFCTGGKATLSCNAQATYQWNLNGAPIAGATAQTYKTKKKGNYTVTVANGFGCTATSDIVTLSCDAEMVNKINTNIAALSVKVLPNPSTTNFTVVVNSSDNKNPVLIKVMDMYGKMVYQTKGASNQQYIFGDKFIAGTYMVYVVQANNTQTFKILKGK